MKLTGHCHEFANKKIVTLDTKKSGSADNPQLSVLGVASGQHPESALTHVKSAVILG